LWKTDDEKERRNSGNRNHERRSADLVIGGLVKSAENRENQRVDEHEKRSKWSLILKGQN